MRKNNIFGKNLIIYSKYLIKGRNLHQLLNVLEKNKITIKNAKKINDNTLILSIKYTDNTKFFAITSNLCYTIKKVKDYGLMYPICFLFANVGLIIGAIFFICICYFSNDFIFDFSFSGSGSVYQREIEGVLDSDGVHKYSRFSDFDLNELSNDILIKNTKLTFVSLKKQGNTLKIYSNKKSDSVKRIDDTVFTLYSNVSGIVESVKVYRGTALVKDGDIVNVGDVLVDGVVYLKDVATKTNVLASVSIISEFEYKFESELDNMEVQAKIFATEKLNKETISEEVKKEKNNGKFTYFVKLNYRTILKVG